MTTSRALCNVSALVRRWTHESERLAFGEALRASREAGAVKLSAEERRRLDQPARDPEGFAAHEWEAEQSRLLSGRLWAAVMISRDIDTSGLSVVAGRYVSEPWTGSSSAARYVAAAFPMQRRSSSWTLTCSMQSTKPAGCLTGEPEGDDPTGSRVRRDAGGSRRSFVGRIRGVAPGARRRARTRTTSSGSSPARSHRPPELARQQIRGRLVRS